MPILTLQKRARELGRIRIGQKGDKGQPEKLDRFRLTSASKPLLEKVAELYGGTVKTWTPQGGAAQWEVITDAKRIPIMVPPQPVTQFLETWSGGGIVHRCDGETNYLTGDPCDFEDPAHVNAKPTTRLNVVLRDVEGIGVWRLESHGWNAAVELPQAADFLAQAGGYVNGWVALEERVSKSEGKTRRYAVPTIEIDVTPAELMAGRGRVAAPAIEGPVERPAIEAAPAQEPAAEQKTQPAKTDWLAEAAKATSDAEVRAIWKNAKDVGDLTNDMHDALAAWAEEIKAALKDAGSQQSTATSLDGDDDPAPDEPETNDEPIGVAEPVDVNEPVDGEIVDDDADAIWAEVVKAAGKKGMSLSQVEAEFGKANCGLSPATASAGELRVFLDSLQQRAA